MRVHVADVDRLAIWLADGPCSLCGETSRCVTINYVGSLLAEDGPAEMPRVCLGDCWPKLVRLITDSAR